MFSVDFVLDQKNVPLLEAYDKWRNWADGKVCCDYALHSCVTWWSPEVAKEMEILCKEKGQFYETRILLLYVKVLSVFFNKSLKLLMKLWLIICSIIT